MTPEGDVELMRQAYQVFREALAPYGRRVAPAESLSPEDWLYILGWARRAVEEERDLREMAEHVTAHVARHDLWESAV